MSQTELVDVVTPLYPFSNEIIGLELETKLSVFLKTI